MLRYEEVHRRRGLFWRYPLDSNRRWYDWVTVMSWTEDAECKTYPKKLFTPDIFDDEGEEWFDDGTIWEAFGDTTEYYKEAKVICDRCPVKPNCLAHAVREKERFSMWGGLTPIERRRIERTARRQRLKDRRALEAMEETT